MKLIFSLVFLTFFLCPTLTGQDIIEDYIYQWRKFYPSETLRSGVRSAVFQYEKRSMEDVQRWLNYNRAVAKDLSSNDIVSDRADRRLLRVKVQSEIDNWSLNSTHTNSLRLYSRLISNAIPGLFESRFILDSEIGKIICQRLSSIIHLSKSAQSNLEQVPKRDLEGGLTELNRTKDYLKNNLIEILESKNLSLPCEDFEKKLSEAIQSLDELSSFGESTLRKSSYDDHVTLGKAEYNRRLRLYTDSDLTSEKLAALALQEISDTKEEMVIVAEKYLLEAYPESFLPSTKADIIKKALRDMEKDAPVNAQEYLEFWQQLADDAISFIQEKDIATLPEFQTLRIQTAPESAGPAARIGWVAAAPPFDPNPVTTLNLPSIPDTLPEQEQIDFWSSFNRPFNRMIVIHELLPGHYMQLKISRETAHPIRLMFPYGPYIEGWATFTEKVLLDEGWEAQNPLTYLAHLRKRLENANRAYTSVQAHCNGWTPEEVMQFSIETSLLAPQFAKSLWGRIERSPMQLTSYFYGGSLFKELFKKEKQRLGKNFVLKFFMDTIMQAGAIPIDEFYDIFERSRSSN